MPLSDTSPTGSASTKASTVVSTRWVSRTRPGLCAEARGQIRHRADGAVVDAPLEADRPERRVAVRDADAEVEVEAGFLPADRKLGHAPAHGRGHPHGPFGRVRHGRWIVEEDHHPVAGETLERALPLEDELAHLGVVLAQHGHDLLGLG